MFLKYSVFVAGNLKNQGYSLYFTYSTLFSLHYFGLLWDDEAGYFKEGSFHYPVG
jgi:hypothetical protein